MKRWIRWTLLVPVAALTAPVAPIEMMVAPATAEELSFPHCRPDPDWICNPDDPRSRYRRPVHHHDDGIGLPPN